MIYKLRLNGAGLVFKENETLLLNLLFIQIDRCFVFFFKS